MTTKSSASVASERADGPRRHFESKRRAPVPCIEPGPEHRRGGMPVEIDGEQSIRVGIDGRRLQEFLTA